MMRSLIASALVLLSAGASAAEPPRFALVLAAAADSTLRAAVSANAEKAAGALRSSGFDVEVRSDLDAVALRRAVRDFSARVEAARGEAVGLLYLAASVTQAGTRNYILPRGSDVARPSDIPIEGVAVADLLTALAAVRAKGRLLAVDAVRGAEMTGVDPGLAALPPPGGTFVILSAKPGQALPGVDGAGRFAAAFAGALAAGGGDAEAVFERVRDGVVRDSGGAQEPTRESGLGEPFAFGNPSVPAVAEAARPVAPPSPPPEPEPSAEPAAPETRAVAAAQPAGPPAAAPSAPVVKPPVRDALPSPDGAPSPGAGSAPPAEPDAAVAAPPAAVPVPQNKPKPPPRPRVAGADPNQGVARPDFAPADPSSAPRNSFGEGGIGRPSDPSTNPGYLVYLGPQTAYRLVTQRNTLQAYGAFVRAYPNHPLSADIRARVSAAPNPGRAAGQAPARPPGPSPFAQPRYGLGYPTPPGFQ